jgi:hypothetical protein
MTLRTLVLCGMALNIGCEASSDEPLLGRCLEYTEPTARLGLKSDDGFEPLDAFTTLQVFKGPQAGFGALCWVETEGLPGDTEPNVAVEVQMRLGETRVGGFAIDSAYLSCGEGQEPGRYGPILLSFDPELYAEPEDLAGIDGRDVELVTTVTTADGTRGTSVQFARFVY